MPLLKRAEKAIRKRLTASFSHQGKSVNLTPGNIIDLPENPKILLLRQDRLGDLIITFPFLNALRSALPNAGIDIVLGKNQSAARYAQPFTDNIIGYGNSLGESFATISSLSEKRYDLAIDLLDNSSTTSTILINRSKAKIKLGFDKENSHAYSHLAPLPNKSNVHIIDRLNSLLPYIGIGIDDIKTSNLIYYDNEVVTKAELVLGSKDKKRLGLVLRGSNDSKYLGKDRFFEMIQKLSDTGYADWDKVIYGTPDKIDDLEWILETAKACGIRNLRYAPMSRDFHLYAAMLTTCDILISPDTSAVHIAADADIPILAYYTIADRENAPMPWLPYSNNHQAVYAVNTLSNLNLDDVVSKTQNLGL
jgi:ADP-heptose:LPS heptosyltransferase